MSCGFIATLLPHEMLYGGGVGSANVVDNSAVDLLDCCEHHHVEFIFHCLDHLKDKSKKHRIKLCLL